MSVPAVAAEATTVPGTLLRAGMVPAVAVTIAVSAVALFQGLPAVTGTGVGAVLAMAALAVGPMLMRLGRNLDPSMMLGLAVCGYAGVVIVLGVVLAVLGSASWLSGEFAGAAAFLAATAWLAGQIRATRRLRILVFGSENSDTRAGHLPKHR